MYQMSKVIETHKYKTLYGTEEYSVNDKRQKHGSYKSWYDGGEKHTECSYTRDKLDGPCKKWFQDGTKRIDCNYKDGALDGVYRETFPFDKGAATCLYKEGRLVQVLSLYDNRDRDCVLPEGE